MATVFNYCAAHDKQYGKLEQCPGCRKSASAVVAAQSPKADTKEMEARESEYRECDKYLRRLAKKWLDEGTAQERPTAIKAMDAASKWARLALEIRQNRLEMEHDQWLVEQNRLMGGGSGN